LRQDLLGGADEPRIFGAVVVEHAALGDGAGLVFVVIHRDDLALPDVQDRAGVAADGVAVLGQDGGFAAILGGGVAAGLPPVGVLRHYPQRQLLAASADHDGRDGS